MNKESFKQAADRIRKTVNYFTNKNPQVLEYFEKQDLEQEVMTHFIEKKFFEKFDSSITTFDYFVARAAKNYLIDISSSIRYADSLDEEVGDGGLRKMDMVQGTLLDQYTRLVLRDMMDSVPDEKISRNYSLTWKRLFQYLVDGYTVNEIHKILGLSSGRVSQLRRQLLDRLRPDFAIDSI